MNKIKISNLHDSNAGIELELRALTIVVNYGNRLDFSFEKKPIAEHISLHKGFFLDTSEYVDNALIFSSELKRADILFVSVKITSILPNFNMLINTCLHRNIKLVFIFEYAEYAIFEQIHADMINDSFLNENTNLVWVPDANKN